MRINKRWEAFLLWGMVCVFTLAACHGSAAPTSNTPTPEAAQFPIPHPSIAITPASGSAGTQVTVVGAGFPADAHVSLRLGAPGAGAGSPAYVESTTDANGRLGLAFVMPAQWPDGRRIAENKIAIIVATDDFSVQAEAGFDYIAPAPPTRPPAPPTPTQTMPAPSADYPKAPADVVNKFLASLMNDPSGNSSLAYLSRDLQAEVRAGRSLLQILGISDLYRSFTLDTQGSSAGGAATFQITLNLDADQQARVFRLDQEDGVWRIHAVAAAEEATSNDPGQVVYDFLISLLKDRSGNRSIRYLSRRLSAEVQGGRSILSILGLQSMYSSFTYEIIVPNAGGVSTIQVTLNYDAGPQARTFTLVQDNGWRIDAIATP